MIRLSPRFGRKIAFSFRDSNLTRITIWSAPVVWQMFYALGSLWFGVASIWGATFREPNMNWITQAPYFWILIAFGIYGLITTLLRFHILHVIQAIGNVFLFSLIFITYCTNSMLASQTTGIYGIATMGAIWLAARVAADNKITVGWKDKNNVQI